MIKFRLTELNREINKVKTVRKKAEYQKILDNLLYRIALGLKQKINKKFKLQAEQPSAPVVRSVRSKFKFTLPKRIPAPFIGKRSGKLRESIFIRKGRYFSTASVAQGHTARFSYIIDWDKNVAPYAEIQEYGGTVKPKSVKFLTIPLQAESVGKSPRSFQNTRQYGRFIFKVLGKRSYLPLYMLSRSVHLPAHKFIRTSVKEYEQNLDKYISEFIFKISNIL